MNNKKIAGVLKYRVNEYGIIFSRLRRYTSKTESNQKNQDMKRVCSSKLTGLIPGVNVGVKKSVRCEMIRIIAGRVQSHKKVMRGKGGVLKTMIP